MCPPATVESSLIAVCMSIEAIGPQADRLQLLQESCWVSADPVNKDLLQWGCVAWQVHTLPLSFVDEVKWYSGVV